MDLGGGEKRKDVTKVHVQKILLGISKIAALPFPTYGLGANVLTINQIRKGAWEEPRREHGDLGFPGLNDWPINLNKFCCSHANWSMMCFNEVWIEHDWVCEASNFKNMQVVLFKNGSF